MVSDNFEIRRTYMALWRVYVGNEEPLHPDFYQEAVGYLYELGHIQYIGQHICFTESGAREWAGELRRIAPMYSDIRPLELQHINRLTGAKFPLSKPKKERHHERN